MPVENCDAGAAAVPRRLPALPVPPPLEGSSSEEYKKRIKEVERKLKAHSTKACLSDEELELLLQELDELQQKILRSSQAEKTAVCNASEEGGEGSGRRLAIKKEIREIEKQLKAMKKLAHRDAKQMLELDSQLDRLKSELTTLQRRIVLSIQLHRAAGSDAKEPVTLALGDRISFAGLSDHQASVLCDRLAAHDELSLAAVEVDGASAAVWDIWRHARLRTTAIRSTDIESLVPEFESVASFMPHVLCIRTASLQARGGICAVLRDFKGVLLVIEDCAESSRTAPEHVSLLHAVAVSARWCAGPGELPLQLAELPQPIQGEVIGDLRWRDIRDTADMSHLVAEAEALCRQEFSDELAEVVDLDGVRIGLLVSSLSKGSAGPRDPKEFLGFIIYKFWGPPLKAMSISRIAVPARCQMQGFGRQLVRWAIEKAKQKPRHECNRATLCATPDAIPFYERLNFTRIPPEELDPDDVPEMPGAVKMEYNYGKARR